MTRLLYLLRSLSFTNENAATRLQQMDSIKTILSNTGLDAKSMEVGNTVSVNPDSEALMPIVIEKTDDGKLSVAHYYSQSGDLLSDPEVLFEIGERSWTPVRITQDPHIQRHDPKGLDLHRFLAVWDRNLQKQGYTKTD